MVLDKARITIIALTNATEFEQTLNLKYESTVCHLGTFVLHFLHVEEK